MSFFQRKPAVAALCAVFALLLSSLPAAAQSWAGKGRLQGEVLTQDGKPVPGAKVTLRKGDGRVDVSTDGPASVTTNDRGKWSVLGLAQGAWGVLIEKDGFQTSEGQVKVDEYSVAQPIRVRLNPAQAQAPAAAQKGEPSPGEEGVAAIEKGNTFLQAGQYAQARAEYEKALSKLETVNHPPILRGIARTYYEEKKSDQAIDTLKKALAIKPDDPDSLSLLRELLVGEGIKSYNDGKLDDALKQFTNVVDQQPQFADAYYYRALTYLGLNKSAEAKADFQKVLDLDPNHPKAAEVKEFISSL